MSVINQPSLETKENEDGYKSKVETTSRKNLRQLFSLMIVVSVIATLGILIFSIFYDVDLVYRLCALIIAVFFGLIAVFTYFKKYEWARFNGNAILPLWINLATLIRGPGFSESTVMMAFLIFTYVLYEDKPKVRTLIIVFTLVCHVGIIFYLNFYPPIIGGVYYPFDEIVVFLLSVGWILVFLKKLEHNKNKMINRLQIKNERLTETAEELERFTYIASHDLKSPLRTIISFSNLIERHLKRGNYDNIKDDLSFIQSGAEQMNYLVSDILEFSKINGQTDIKRRDLDLTAVVAIVESNLRTEIKEKDARILKQSLPTVYGNETEFVLLFQNLIQNGIKYNNSESPVVKIWSDEKGDTLNIYFKDNGIGIDESFHDQIFQFFNRLHTKEQYQGTGLGLGLSTKIIKNYNGSIAVESALGEGSTFCIKLPLSSKRVATPELELAEAI